MYLNKRNLLLAVTLVILSVGFFSGCSPVYMQNNENGSIRISVKIPSNISQAGSFPLSRFIHPDTQKMTVTVSSADMDVLAETKKISSGQDEISIELNNVPVGKNRELKVSLYDSADNLLAEGTTAIDVETDGINTAEITAVPKKFITLGLNESTEISSGGAGKTVVYALNIASAGTYTITLGSAGIIPVVFNMDGHKVAAEDTGENVFSFEAVSAGLHYIALSLPASYSAAAVILAAPFIPVVKSSAKELTAFGFSDPAATGTISGANISVTVPAGTNVTALAPTVAHNGASVSPASGTAQNFTKAVTYTVTAEDGSTQAYTVTVTVAPSSAKELTAFGFTDPAATGTISGTNIAVTVPTGTNVTALVPTVAHNGASVSPSSGTAQNFSKAVTYTVTAADGTSQTYTVTVTVAASSAKEITSFTLIAPSVSGTISGTNITLSVPYGTNLTALVPAIAHTGAGIAPASGVSQNFTNPVTYTVTAVDGTTSIYTVTADIGAPSGYSASIPMTFINNNNKGNGQLGISGAIPGTTYNYTFTSSGGGTPVSGSGSNVSATTSIDGIDLSGLSDGTLTLSVTLSGGGKTGTAVTASATKDTVPPAAFTLTHDRPLINLSQNGTIGFTFVGAETGASFSYVYTSSGGGSPVTGTGMISTSNQAVTGISHSSLNDGGLTLVGSLTDPAGNTFSVTESNLMKDTVGPTVTLSNSIGARTAVRQGESVTITAVFPETLPSTPTIIIPSVVSGVAMSMVNAYTYNYTMLVPAGNFSATVSITASDIYLNPCSAPTGVVNYTIDNTAPAITAVSYNPPSGTLAAGNSLVYTINAGGEMGLTGSSLVINGKAAVFSGTGPAYTVTYTVAVGDTVRTAGGIPVSLTLVDAAGNISVAYTTSPANVAVSP